MHSKTLLVKCKRGDLRTDYAYFVVGHWDGLRFDPLPCQRQAVNAVKIVYIMLRDSTLINKSSEVLPFAEYEEAALLHDGHGWNMGEVAAWVKGLEVQGDLVEDNVTPALDRSVTTGL